MPEVLKVTDPNKVVTDPVLLSILAKQGIDKDYVEFFQDYASRSLGKEHSPYAKFYRDLNSNKRFMVVSGLPMVDADGVKIEAGWRVAGINYFSEKNNLFRAKVQGTDVELTIRNDQPDGRKANDKLSYKSQLFLDGVEQFCGQSTLLPIDPVNPNYLENTLEWDYGICKRRLRIIEGSILGCWVFAQKPNGEIRIKYNQTGDYKLRLGQFKISDDEEVVNPEDFDSLAELQGGYPIVVSDSATYYPDADPETTSVDGVVERSGVNETWAVIRVGAGTGADDVGTNGLVFYFYATTTTNQWQSLRRSIFLFDTSGLPDNAIISAATLSLYGYAKADYIPSTPSTNIYSSNPASNTALAGGDYNSLGSTAFSTDITYAGWSISAYNNFTLNSSGIAAISKVGVSKFGGRNSQYDVAGSAPPWTSGGNSWVKCYFAEQGAGYQPKLVVTYAPVVAPTVTTQDCTNVADTSATGNGNITATGGENCSRRGICYMVGTSGDPTTANSVAYDDGSFGTGAYTKGITGLSPGTNYRVRAYAVNSAGTGYGTTVQLTTSNHLTKTDSGAGADTKATNNPKASFSKTETGSGTDASTSRLASLSKTDLGSGLDTKTLLASLTKVDQGSGIDFILSKIFRVADVGAGVDAKSLLASLTKTDAGSGLDTKALLANLTKADSGIGTDFILSKIFRVTDTGTGMDTLASLLAALAKSDSGLGIETLISLLVALAKVDVGAGTDARLALLVSLLKSDIGAGIEHITNRGIMLADTGTGLDVLVPLIVTLTKTDTGLGVDTLTALAALITKVDTGVGVDILITLLAKLSKVDTGSGIDLILSKVFGSTDYGIGVDLILSKTFAVIDSGIGIDALVSLLAKLSKVDTGSGIDLISSRAFDLADSGIGLDFVLSKIFADTDSGIGLETIIDLLVLPIPFELTKEEYQDMLTKIAELELGLEPKAQFRI